MVDYTGKTWSKADVSINIYAFIKAQITGEKVEIHCAIGDKIIDGITYDERSTDNYFKLPIEK